MIYYSIFLAIIGIMLLMWAGWRTSIKSALILVIFEGAIRKWILPASADVIYFLKDAVLIFAYFQYFIFEKNRTIIKLHSSLFSLLWIFAGTVLVQAFNTKLGSYAVGAFGFKVYVVYIPLCFLVHDLFDNVEDFEKNLRYYTLIALPICLLGIFQYLSPPDSWINSYVGADESFAAATFGSEDIGLSRVRITGTFSYLSGYAAYLTVCFALAVPFLALGLEKIWFWLMQITLLLVIGNMFMSGSRATILFAILFITLFMAFNPFARVAGIKRKSAFLPIAIALVLGGIGTYYFFSDATEQFIYRSKNADVASDRIAAPFLEPIEYIVDGKQNLWGFGSGSTHPGGLALRNKFDLGDPVDLPPLAEVESLRVLIEIGLFGFFVYYLLKLYLIYLLFLTWRSLSIPILKFTAFSALLVHALYIANTVVLNHTINVYFWFMAGLIFLLPRLEQKTVLQTTSTLATNQQRQVRDGLIAPARQVVRSRS